MSNSNILLMADHPLGLGKLVKPYAVMVAAASRA
jgi:hypothetical protein